MTRVEVFAPAKINLTLHITRRREDGYHELDSLVAFADVGDTVTVTGAATVAGPGEKARLAVHGAESEGVPGDGSNLVTRAIDMMVGDVAPFVTLEKNLPAASGIGGGSSDAAAAMRAVAHAWDIPLPEAGASEAMRMIARTLGADVPLCLFPRPCRARGIGEILEPADLPVLHAVIANPREAVPTGPVFAALEKTANPAMDWPPKTATPEAFIEWLGTCRNDLESAARSVAPVIDRVLDRLARLPGARLARMSGSGATCFALFDSAALTEEAGRVLGCQEPRWWVHTAKLGDMRDRAAPRAR